jgi:hypothetical protein
MPIVDTLTVLVMRNDIQCVHFIILIINAMYHSIINSSTLSVLVMQSNAMYHSIINTNYIAAKLKQ